MEWIGKTRGKIGSKGHTDYDVLVSVIKSKTITDPDRTAAAIVFRNNAYRVALALNAKTVKRSPLFPNSSRLYFLFESEDKDDIGVKLCSDGKAQAYRARFPFISKTEAQTVSGAWIGEYSIKYDKEEGAHYIERRGK